jgi:hypothetical protein
MRILNVRRIKYIFDMYEEIDNYLNFKCINIINRVDNNLGHIIYATENKSKIFT